MGHNGSSGKGRAAAFIFAHIDYPGDECLIWPFCLNNHGYPLLGYQGQLLRGHRFMCEMAHGTAPTDQHHAAHSCGNMGCVNPRHLSWKTAKENMADNVRLGAVRKKGDRPRHKLTEEQVAQIKALKGKMSYPKIAAQFGVKPKQIGRIHRGEQWITGKKLFRNPPTTQCR